MIRLCGATYRMSLPESRLPIPLQSEQNYINFEQKLEDCFSKKRFATTITVLEKSDS